MSRLNILVSLATLLSLNNAFGSDASFSYTQYDSASGTGSVSEGVYMGIILEPVEMPAAAVTNLGYSGPPDVPASVLGAIAGEGTGYGVRLRWSGTMPVYGYVPTPEGAHRYIVTLALTQAVDAVYSGSWDMTDDLSSGFDLDGDPLWGAAYLGDTYAQATDPAFGETYSSGVEDSHSAVFSLQDSGNNGALSVLVGFRSDKSTYNGGAILVDEISYTGKLSGVSSVSAGFSSTMRGAFTGFEEASVGDSSYTAGGTEYLGYSSATSNGIVVVTNTLSEYGANCFIFDATNNSAGFSWTSDVVDVAGQTGVTVRLSWKGYNKLDAADWLRFSADIDGLVTNMLEVAGSSAEAQSEAYQSFLYSVPAGARQVQLVFSGYVSTADELWAFDDVGILGTGAASGTVLIIR